MPSTRRLSSSVPLWALTLLALISWGIFNGLQHRAWYTSTCYSQARPDGEFEDCPAQDAPLPSIYLDSDSLYWLHNAAQLLEEGTWRPRRIDWDNVPAGRDNHWSSPLLWAMAGTARIGALFTDQSAVELLPHTAPWINPVLFALFLMVTAILLGRRLSPWTAGLLVLALATLPPIMRSFSVLHIDHHGLIDIPALWMSLFLLLGMIGKTPTEPETDPQPSDRRWFVAAGILGGLGLWLQASHQLILIAGVLLALLLWALFARGDFLSSLNPVHWRIWACSGAAVSLAATLLEYAPSHFGMQLEVNHPLYALSWWGSIEAILALARARKERKWTPSRLAVIAGGFLPALVTVLLIRHGPAQWFSVSIPYLQRIHEQIKEFQPLLKTLNGINPLLLFLLFNTLPLIALHGVFLWASPGRSPRIRLALQVSTFILLPSTALCLLHTRYSSLMAATLWGMAVMVSLAIHRGPTAGKRRWVNPALLAIGCLMNLLLTFSPLLNTEMPFMPVARWIPEMLRRDVARELSALPGFSGSRVLCDYNIAPHLQAFADVRTTGGLYWENAEGLWTAALFFAETDDQQARQLLRDRQIEWVLYQAMPNSPATWQYIRYGAPARSMRVPNIADRLNASRRIPWWLERVPPEQTPLASKTAFQVYHVKQ